MPECALGWGEPGLWIMLFALSVFDVTGMSCRLTGMTGSLTDVDEKFGTLLTTMAVNQQRIIQFLSISMYVQHLTPSQPCGTEQRLLGGDGPLEQNFILYTCYVQYYSQHHYLHIALDINIVIDAQQ